MLPIRRNKNRTAPIYDVLADILPSYDRWLDMDRMFSELDKVFAVTSKPLCSISRGEHSVLIEVPVPGFALEDIHADLDQEKGYLTVTAERGKKKLQQEIFVGWTDVDLSKISHTCENGLLSFDIPFMKEEEKAPTTTRLF